MIEFNLTKKMEQACMTAYRLAQITEIHETQIGKLKNGKAKGITFETLDKLCEALNCEPADLLVRVRDRAGKRTAKEKKTTKESKQRRFLSKV
jgi:putative transcriptional regulator